ncbi:MAG: DUF6873 family GME fold protein [Candidatus Omnitrophota bacterium]
MVIIHDKRLPDKYLKALADKCGACVFFSFSGPRPGGCTVYDSILCHPDIYFFQIAGDTLIFSPSIEREDADELKKNGIRLIRGEARPHGRYPCTAPYNALRAGDNFFHKTACTDSVILERVKEAGLRLVDVKQGYTRCSAVFINDNAVITSDGSIAAVAERESIDVLFIPPGSITLPGEIYGFIGGASGRMPDGTTVFLGDIETHPEFPGIRDFFVKHEKRYIDLKGLPLYDAGSLIICDSYLG